MLRPWIEELPAGSFNLVPWPRGHRRRLRRPALAFKSSCSLMNGREIRPPRAGVSATHLVSFHPLNSVIGSGVQVTPGQKDPFILPIRIREIHKRLAEGGRGRRAQPAEWRRLQLRGAQQDANDHLHAVAPLGCAGAYAGTGRVAAAKDPKFTQCWSLALRSFNSCTSTRLWTATGAPRDFFKEKPGIALVNS